MLGAADFYLNGWRTSSPGSPSITTFTDTFAAKNTTLWAWGPNASVVNGQLNLSMSGTYQGITSNQQYNLLGATAYVQLVQPPNVGTGSTDFQFFITTPSGNELHWIWEGGTLYAQRKIGGVTTNVTSGPYNAATHKWFAFSESNGVVTWSTSPDGSTWTPFGTWTTSTIVLSVVNVAITTGYWGTETTPGTAIVDNFNTLGVSSPSATTVGSISLGGGVAAQNPVAAASSVQGGISLGGAVQDWLPAATWTATDAWPGPDTTGSVAATATGSITLGGTSTPQAAGGSAGIAGGIALGGAVVAKSPASVAGNITLATGGVAVAPQVAGGSVVLGGTVTSTAPSSAVGAITLTGASPAAASTGVTGGIAIGGTSTSSAVVAAVGGGVSLGGAVLAQAVGTGAGTITLGGLTSSRATASTSGAITIGGSSIQGALAAASGVVALAGTVSAQAASGTTGSITIGGTASGTGLFTPAPADTATVLDAVILDRGASSADTGAVTDDTKLTTGRVLDDAAALTDVGVSSLDMPRSAADDSSVTDVVVVTRGLVPASADMAVISDAATTIVVSQQAVGDVVGVADSVTVGLASAGQQSVADNLSVGDSVDSAHEVVLSADESSLATDGVQVSRGLAAAGADLAGVSDSAVMRQDQNSTPSDMASITDSVVPLLSTAGGSSAADQVGLSDVASGQQELVRSAADSAAGSDLVSAATGFVRAATDLAAGSDSVTIGLGTGAGIADVAAGTDQLESAAATTRSAADLVVAGDAVSVIRTVSIVAADAVAATDVAGTGAGGALSVSDESVATDQVALAHGVAPSDVVAATDAVTAQVTGDVYRTYFDDVRATDSIEVVRTVAVTAADQAIGRDALNLGDLYRTAVLDATAVVESQSRSVGPNTGVQQVHRLAAAASVGVDAVGSVGVDPQHAVITVQATGTLRRPTSVSGEVVVSPRIGAAQLWAIRALTDVLVRELEKYVNGDWKPVPSADLRPAPVHYPSARPMPAGVQPIQYKRVFRA